MLVPQVRNCHFEDEGESKIFKSYSRYHCLLECLANSTKVFYNCSLAYEIKAKNAEDEVCFPQEFVNYDADIEKRCNCLPNCNLIQLQIIGKEFLKIDHLGEEFDTKFEILGKTF